MSSKGEEKGTVPFDAPGFKTGVLLMIEAARRHALNVHGKKIKRSLIATAIRRKNLYTERMEQTGFHVIHHDDFDEWLEGR